MALSNLKENTLLEEEDFCFSVCLIPEFQNEWSRPKRIINGKVLDEYRIMSYSYHGIGIFYDGEYRSDYCNKIIKHTLVTTGRGLMSSVGEEQCTIKLAWLRMFENVYNVGEGELGGGESTIHGQHRH